MSCRGASQQVVLFACDKPVHLPFILLRHAQKHLALANTAFAKKHRVHKPHPPKTDPKQAGTQAGTQARQTAVGRTATWTSREGSSEAPTTSGSAHRHLSVHGGGHGGGHGRHGGWYSPQGPPGEESDVPPEAWAAAQFVYFTEMDNALHVASPEVFDMLVNAMHGTPLGYVSPNRMNKKVGTAPGDVSDAAFSINGQNVCGRLPPNG